MAIAALGCGVASASFFFVLQGAPRTIAYWQLDDNNTDYTDSVGSYALTRLGGEQSNLRPVAVIPNPDEDPLFSGDPVNNPWSVYNPSMQRNVYDAELDMRDSSWTMEGWIKTDQRTADTTAQYIVGTRHSSSGWTGWHLMMWPSGQLSLYMQKSGGSATVSANIAPLTDLNWHHIAVVWDHDNGSGGKASLYVDGMLEAEAAGAGDLGYHSGRRFVLGVREKNGSGFVDDPFLGHMDEFRFSAAALGSKDFLMAPPVVSPTEQVHEIAETHIARHPNAPKQSDVVFSSRSYYTTPPSPDTTYNTLQAAAAFHATRVDWIYVSSATIPITQNTFAALHGAGYPVTVALNHNLGGSSHPALDLAGNPVEYPWLPGQPVASVPASGFLNTYVNTAKYFINNGMQSTDGFQMDGAKLHDILNYGADYSADSMAAFNVWLPNAYPDPSAEFGISFGLGWSYKDYLNTGNTNDALAAAFADFYYDSSEIFYGSAYGQIETYFNSAFSGHTPSFSHNDESAYESLHAHADFSMAEYSYFGNNPSSITRVMSGYEQLGRQFVPTMPKYNPPHDPASYVADIRRYIATMYALGANPIVPWDVYHPGQDRYYGPAGDYAWLYEMVASYPAYFDGYETAAFAGPGLTDLRYGAAALAPVRTTGNNTNVYAFLRAKPNNVSAPVVVHLVTWNDQRNWINLYVDKNRIGRTITTAKLIFKLVGQPTVSVENRTVTQEGGDYYIPVRPHDDWCIVVLD